MSGVRRRRGRSYRLLQGAALVSITLVAAAWLSVLHDVVTVVGGRATFIFAVGGAVAFAALLASALSHRHAVAVSGVLLALGLAGYLNSVPPGYWEVMGPRRFVEDMVALLTGYNVIRMTNAGTWAIAVAPGPAFLVTYFGVRGEFVRSATFSAIPLGFFVLTGDANTAVTLGGALGVAGALGFTALARHGGSRDQIETLAAAMAVMILASATVTAVPGGTGTPLLPNRGGAVQTGLVNADDRADIGGSIRLSPKVRFVVESERRAYWRAAAYDRYTGEGWVRTGDSDPFSGDRADPPGDRVTINQTFTAKSPIQVFAAAARPQRVSGASVRVTDQGTLDLAGALDKGESYTVTSRHLNATPRELRRAGRDYPAEIRSQYLQIPGSTGDRVGALTDNLTAGANSPYAEAKVIEAWLESTKDYSTSVDRPSGGVAESFLFEMESGYCVYFATTMVTMLRTQGIPARYVVGYTPGQRVAEDTWVVRGYDSHAWVEAYFPGHGWVRFDPTPAGERASAEREELASARADGVEGVDVPGSRNGTWTPTETTEPADTVNVTGAQTVQGPDQDPFATLSQRPTVSPGSGGTAVGTVTVPSLGGADVATGDGNESGSPAAGSGGGPSLPSLPPIDVLAIWSVLGVGLLAGARRTGLLSRAYRAAWLRWLPRTEDGGTAVEAAFDRVEYVLERTERERRPGETVREYLASIDADERARTVASIRERARYAGQVSEAEIERARRLAGELVSERTGVSRFAGGGDNV